MSDAPLSFGGSDASAFADEPATPRLPNYESEADVYVHGAKLAERMEAARTALASATTPADRLAVQHRIDKLAIEADHLHAHTIKSASDPIRRAFWDANLNESHAQHAEAKALHRTVSDIRAERTSGLRADEIPSRLGTEMAARYERHAGYRLSSRDEAEARAHPYGQLDAPGQRAVDAAAVEADAHLHALETDPELIRARRESSHPRHAEVVLAYEQARATIAQRTVDDFGSPIMPDPNDPGAWPESMRGLLPDARVRVWNAATRQGGSVPSQGNNATLGIASSRRGDVLAGSGEVY